MRATKIDLNEKISNSKFSFVKKSNIFIIISLVIIALGIIFLSIFGFNLGLDFTGGTILQIETGSSISDSKTYQDYKNTISDVLKQNGLTLGSSQKQGENSKMSISIRFQDLKGKTEEQMTELTETVKTNIISALNAKNGDVEVTISGSERISGNASGRIILNACLAIALAVIAMLIYIAFKYEFYSGLCTVISLLHDVLIMCALCVFFRIQINSAFIAAIITIIGYSINNTIVVFDRIREIWRNNLGSNTLAFPDMVDKGIKDTLMRTINTSLTTFLAVFMLAILGVSSIQEFVLPIIFGLVAGTYSSMFIAGPLLAKISTKKDIKFRVKKPIINQ